jgi:arsenic resistance protein ArsH
MTTNGDLNNTAAERLRKEVAIDAAYHERSFAIASEQDDRAIRKSYRPFLINDELSKDDWISKLELSAVLKMVESLVLNAGEERLRVLVLHGSMRSR